MATEKKDLVEKEHVSEQANKPYTTPQLTVHGTVEKLTGKIGVVLGDSVIGSSLIL